MSEKEQAEFAFETPEVPVAQWMLEHEHEPNGPFWVSVSEFLKPELAERLEFDEESDYFSVVGSPADVGELRDAVTPYLNDATKLEQLLQRAEAEDFVFDD